MSRATGTYAVALDFGGEGIDGLTLAVDTDAGAGGTAVVTIGATVCSAEGDTDGYGEATLGYQSGTVDATLEITGAAMTVGVLLY